MGLQKCLVKTPVYRKNECATSELNLTHCAGVLLNNLPLELNSSIIAYDVICVVHI